MVNPPISEFLWQGGRESIIFRKKKGFFCDLKFFWQGGVGGHYTLTSMLFLQKLWNALTPKRLEIGIWNFYMVIHSLANKILKISWYRIPAYVKWRGVKGGFYKEVVLARGAYVTTGASPYNYLETTVSVLNQIVLLLYPLPVLFTIWPLPVSCSVLLWLVVLSWIIALQWRQGCLAVACQWPLATVVLTMSAGGV